MEKLETLLIPSLMTLESDTKKPYYFYGDLYISKHEDATWSFLFVSYFKNSLRTGNFTDVAQVRHARGFKTYEETLKASEGYYITEATSIPEPIKA